MDVLNRSRILEELKNSKNDDSPILSSANCVRSVKTEVSKINVKRVETMTNFKSLPKIVQ